MSASRPAAVTRGVRGLLLPLWVVVLALVVLGPVLAPGYALSYDMVWVPDLSVTRADTWGLGSSIPRAVPSDAAVAVLGVIVPQQLLQKLLLLGALVAAGLGGAALTRSLGSPAQWAAATILVWNPFVAERLAIGHWPLLLAYAATPWLVLAVRDRRFGVGTLLLAVTALSPASGVMGVVVALVVGRTRDAWRWALLALAVNAPWILASLASPASLRSDAAGVDVFAARGTESTPVWLEVVSLGGVWNADVRPGSRETVVATILSVLLVAAAALGMARLWKRGHRLARPLVALWVIGFVVALVGAVAPGLLSALVETIPGVGLVRDGSRWVVLMAPATALGLAGCVELLASRRASVVAAWLVALVLPIALVPDLGWGVGGQVRAVEYPAAWAEIDEALTDQSAPGDLLSLPFSPFRAPEWNRQRPVLDPAGRYFDRVTVTDDTLTVGDVDIAGEDPRAARVGRALETGDWDAMGAAGVGFVVFDTSAFGASQVADRVAELPLVASSGTLELRRVPALAESQDDRVRTAVVVAGWLVAAVTLAGVIVQSVRRRRSATVAGR